MQVYVPMAQSVMDDTFMLVRPESGSRGRLREPGARGDRPRRPASSS